MCRYILIVHQGENLESTGQRGVDQVEGKRECNVARMWSSTEKNILENQWLVTSPTARGIWINCLGAVP